MFAFVEDMAKETDLLQTLNDPHPYFTPHLFYNNLTNNSPANSDNRGVCCLHDNIINQKLTLNQFSESVLKRTTTEQFLFYDLMLKKADLDLLTLVKIADFGVMSYEPNDHNLLEQVANFLFDTLANQELISAINKIILKLVGEILNISNVHVARISLVAQNKDLEPSFPCWHIDKTIAEENDLISSHQEYVFIVVLKGATTLYQKIDNQTRIRFFHIANQTSHSYGYDINLHYHKNQGLDYLFNVKNSDSARPGQGSVHLSGKLQGTVHASPPEGTERLVLIVTAQEINQADLQIST